MRFWTGFKEEKALGWERMGLMGHMRLMGRSADAAFCVAATEHAPSVLGYRLR
jgi:hypothetical protein